MTQTHSVEVVDGVPRRIRADLFTPAERAIADAMAAVEAVGAHPRLTDAVVLLSHARDAVADAVEILGKTTPAPRTQAREPLNALAAQVNAINVANGWAVLTMVEWNETYKVPGVLALIHSEVSEALEAFRVDDRKHFAEELADVVIRCLDCAGGLGIDLDAEVAKKLEKNRGRGHKHGGKRV